MSNFAHYGISQWRQKTEEWIVVLNKQKGRLQHGVIDSDAKGVLADIRECTPYLITFLRNLSDVRNYTSYAYTVEFSSKIRVICCDE